MTHQKLNIGVLIYATETDRVQVPWGNDEKHPSSTCSVAAASAVSVWAQAPTGVKKRVKSPNSQITRRKSTHTSIYSLLLCVFLRFCVWNIYFSVVQSDRESHPLLCGWRAAAFVWTPYALPVYRLNCSTRLETRTKEFNWSASRSVSLNAWDFLFLFHGAAKAICVGRAGLVSAPHHRLCMHTCSLFREGGACHPSFGVDCTS